MKAITARVKNKYHSFKRYLHWWKYLRFPIKKKIYLLGTPDHGNIGDSAIVIAELTLLHHYFPKVDVKEVTYNEYEQDREYIKRIITKKSLIIGHGGGNIGNTWYAMEQNRYKILADFPKNAVLIMPQTVYFTHDKNGEKTKRKSFDVYDRHDQLTIIARDKVSYNILSELNNTTILLSPDIVMSLPLFDSNLYEVKRRNGVLCIFRNDIEKGVSNEQINHVEEILHTLNMDYSFTDMISNTKVSKNNRREVVEAKLNQVASAELIITDRMHGMIFAAITGTPCIVFGNNHHKVEEAYKWISYLPYIEFIQNTDRIEDLIRKMLTMKNNTFDYKPLLSYYEQIVQAIHEKI